MNFFIEIYINKCLNRSWKMCCHILRLNSKCTLQFSELKIIFRQNCQILVTWRDCMISYIVIIPVIDCTSNICMLMGEYIKVLNRDGGTSQADQAITRPTIIGETHIRTVKINGWKLIFVHAWLIFPDQCTTASSTPVQIYIMLSVLINKSYAYS